MSFIVKKLKTGTLKIKIYFCFFLSDTFFELTNRFCLVMLRNSHDLIVTYRQKEYHNKRYLVSHHIETT